MKYYSQKLSALRLKQVYDLATPEVENYLKAEIDFITKYISCGDMVLDLGCGYGRIIPDLLKFGAGKVVGYDLAFTNLVLGKEYLDLNSGYDFVNGDAEILPFQDNTFNITVCIQNGLSAFHIPPEIVVKESLRVTKVGGYAIFSTYSDKFWEHRLEWFQRQVDAGLLGKIDWEQTKNGTIVCKDGFKALTFKIEDLTELVKDLKVEFEIEEVADSIVFLVLKKII